MKIMNKQYGAKYITATIKTKGEKITLLFMRPHMIAIYLYCFELFWVCYTVVGCPVLSWNGLFWVVVVLPCVVLSWNGLWCIVLIYNKYIV